MLAFTSDHVWEPGIGDPSLMGWMTVVAYFAAALLCVRSARVEWHRSHRGSSLRLFLFWCSVSLFLFGLGINKQLDLQTWFTLFAKRLALDQGWYESRRGVQVLFIGCVALGGVTALGLLVWLARPALRQNLPALVGCLFLTCFVLIRASSFHQVDQFLGFRVGGLKMNWVLELGGICLVAFAAWRHWRGARHAKTATGERPSPDAARWHAGRPEKTLE